jgi:hypothetical protein
VSMKMVVVVRDRVVDPSGRSRGSPDEGGFGVDTKGLLEDLHHLLSDKVSCTSPVSLLRNGAYLPCYTGDTRSVLVAVTL